MPKKVEISNKYSILEIHDGSEEDDEEEVGALARRRKEW